METNRSIARKMGFWEEYTASDAYKYINEIAQVACENLAQPREQDLEITKYVSQRYFFQAGPNGQSVLNVVEAIGRSAPSTYDHLRQECSLEFGVKSVRDSGLFQYNADTQRRPIDDAIVRVVSNVYKPNNAAFVRLGNGIYFNTWKAPAYAYDHNLQITDEMLAPWREFLERWFPEENERDFFERWLAVTIVKPEIHVDMAVLLRSEQGVGKNFLWDRIVQPLAGRDNCPTVTMKKMMNEYAGDLYDSTAILVDELYSNKKNAADALKPWVTQRDAFVNVKYKAQYKTTVNTNLILTSNTKTPLYIEEGDRRYWVPEFIIHKDSLDETAGWIAEVMVPWVEGGGLQYLRNHLKHVVDETDFKLFNRAPFTVAKQEIIAKDTKPELKERLAEFLDQRRGYTLYITGIQDWPEFRERLSQTDIRQVLEDRGYVSGRPQGEDGKKTTAYRHEATWAARKKWPESWTSDKERRGKIEVVEPVFTTADKLSAKGFNADEQRLYEALIGSNVAPVLANWDDHPVLIQWAYEEGKLVNISRETALEKMPAYRLSRGKWGNPFSEPKDGTNEEVVKKHREWLLEGDGRPLLEHVEELREKVLVCNCNCTSSKKRKKCHGELLVECAEPLPSPFT